MAHFRRVDGAAAGPNALGVLVPPGTPTLVILRARALDYDLLPIRATLRNGLGSGFCDLDRAGATVMAQALVRALEECAAAAATCLGPIPAADGAGYWVQAEIGEFTLLLCRRQPGAPYRAHAFSMLADARDAAAVLRRVLCPAEGAGQELYCNTQSFLTQ